MKLAEMTIPEKSRWMADKSEPLSTLPECFGIHSPLRFWKSGLINHIPYKRRGDWAWEPRNMTDPEMTLMLRADLAKRFQWQLKNYGPTQFNMKVWTVSAVDGLAEMLVANVNADTESVAVLDAAMLAHGFKKE